MSDAYDSTLDTLKHSRRVDELLLQMIGALQERLTKHDLSKMEPPEKDVYDEFTPKLKGSTYGSDEYKSFLRAMGEGLQHHYDNNAHHPEHNDNGVYGMSLVDVFEMLADWKAATERHATGNLAESLKLNKGRFGMSDMLVKVMENTARDLGWL